MTAFQTELLDGALRNLRETPDPLSITLDASQDRIVSNVVAAGGHHLIKGAAGTGKSTVLLNIIKRLRDAGIDHRDILLVTYTKGLVTASSQILSRHLKGSMSEISVKTLDSVMGKIVYDADRDFARREMLESDSEALQQIVQACRAKVISTAEPSVRESFERTSAKLSDDYLTEEIESVIIGHDLQTLQDYRKHRRSGRQIVLQRQEREFVWEMHRHLAQELSRLGCTTRARKRRYALYLVKTGKWAHRYSAVIVDEAQDLPPHSLNLLTELSRPNSSGMRRVIFAADMDQTIYGSGYSWAMIHPDINFRGRTYSLNTIFRCTREIEAAAEAYLSGAELEESDDARMYQWTGDRPTLALVESRAEEDQEIVRYIRQMQSKLPISSMSVLTYKQDRATAIAELLREHGFPALKMKRDEVDLSYDGISVMTCHTAKGMEFPCVVVALEDLRELHDLDSEERDEELEIERRVIHMAITRAMQYAHLIINRHHDRERLDGLMTPAWDIIKA